MGKGSAEVIAASPSGGFYAIGGSQGVRFYNTSTLLETAFFRADGTIYEIGVSANGQLFAVSPMDTVLVARTADLRVLLRVEETGWLIALSPDNSLVAYVTSCEGAPECRDHIRIWDITTSTDLHDLSLESSGPILHFNHLAISPDSTLLAAAGQDKAVYLWDFRSGAPMPSLEGHSRPVTWVEFSPDGLTLVSGAEDRTVRLWSLQGQSPPRVLGPLPAAVESVSFSANGGEIFIRCADGSLQVRMLPSGEILSTEPNVPDPDVAVLATIVARDGYIWPHELAYSPDGRILVGASFHAPGVFFFDVATGECLGVADTTETTELVYSASGTYLVAAYDEGLIHIVDTATRTTLRRISTSFIYSAVLSPDDRILALDTKTGIELRELPSGDLLRTIPVIAGYLKAFSPDGDFIIADDQLNASVTVWGVHDGRLRSTFALPVPPSFDRILALDSETVATGNIDYVRGDFIDTVDLWKIGEKVPPITLTGITDRPEVVFSPDGRLVVVEYWYGTNFYQRSTGRLIYTYDETQPGPNDFAFAPDGLSLAGDTADGEIVIWDISSIAAAAGP